MKKIALILSTRPRDGGQHQYAMLIVESLVDKKDIDLVVFSGNAFWRKWCKEKKIPYLGYELPYFSEKEQEFNYNYSRISRIYYTYMTDYGKKIRKEKIDILFSLYQGAFLPNYKVKILSPVHDLMHRYERNFPEVASAYESREIYMKCFAKYTSCILVDSKLGKQQFEESYSDELGKKKKVISLPFVVPEHIVHITDEYIETPEKYVFYPAQFWKHKNHLNLVKAINILKEQIPDIHLILVGSEKNNYKEIRDYIVKQDLERYVTVLGFVSDGNITYLYRHAVGMIMPSYFGPTNIPPLEAMALGCPVAVSNKYAMPEQVGSAGLLFDPDSPKEIAECIKRLWTDGRLREKMRKEGDRRIQRWTRDKFASRLIQIIKWI